MAHATNTHSSNLSALWVLSTNKTPSSLTNWKEIWENHIHQLWSYLLDPVLKWYKERESIEHWGFKDDDSHCPAARTAIQKRNDMERMLMCLSLWIPFLEWTQLVYSTTTLQDVWYTIETLMGHVKPVGFVCDLGGMLLKLKRLFLSKGCTTTGFYF